MNDAVLYVEYSLKYTNSLPLPVEDVVESLRALRRISRNFLPAALSRLSDAEVLSAELLVEGFEVGSFKENLILRLLFKDEAALDRFTNAFRTLDVPEMYRNLPWSDRPVLKGLIIGTLVGGLIVYGIAWYNEGSGTTEEKALIEASNNQIIAIGSDAFAASPEQIQAIIVAAVGARKKELAADVAKVVAPAHREEGAALVIDEAVTIPHAVVRTMPTNVDFQPYEQTTKFHNAVVDIRKTNRDSAVSGWEGKVANVSAARLKLSAGDGVNLTDLAGRLEVRANIAVVYRMNEQTNGLEPAEIVIEAVLPDEG